MRTNEEFDSCRVRKGRDDIVDITDRDRGQQVSQDHTGSYRNSQGKKFMDFNLDNYSPPKVIDI